MRFRQALSATLIATTLLTACTSYRGAQRLHDYRDTKSMRTAHFYGVRQIFMADLGRHLAYRNGNKERLAAPAMKPLLNSGFSLIRLSCNEYFNEMGRNQRNSAIVRDLIKPVTDAVNLVIGLKLLSNVEDTNALLTTGFAGLSSAGASGLDIYDRHFLFDNDNIAAVRTMTMNALAENREAVYKTLPEDVVLAIGQLQENENLCTPAQIVSNVREQIKKGDFETKSSGDGKTKPANGTNTNTNTNTETNKNTNTDGSGTVPAGSESHTTTPG